MRTRIFLVIVTCMMLFTSVSFAQTTQSSPSLVTKYCSKCSTCTALLEDPDVDIVKLNASITDISTSSGACIIPAGNKVYGKTFDCRYNNIQYSIKGVNARYRSGIKIVGDGTTQPEYVSIKNCIIRNYSAYDEIVSSGNPIAGILIVNAQTVFVTNNNVYHGQLGISVTGEASSDIHVQGNVVHDIKWAGISIWNGADYNYVSDNEVYSTKYGISPCHNANDNSIYENDIHNNSFLGVCFCTGANNNDLYNNIFEYNGSGDPSYGRDIGINIPWMDPAGVGNSGWGNSCYSTWEWEDNNPDSCGCEICP